MDPYVQLMLIVALGAAVYLILLMIGRAWQDRDKER